MEESFYAKFSSPGNVRKWFLLVGVVLFLGILLLVNKKEVSAPSHNGGNNPINNNQTGNSSNVFLTVTFDKNKQARTFQGPSMPGMTVADTIAVASQVGHFNVTFDMANGVISSIDDASATSWKILKNGSPLSGKIIDTAVGPGDRINVEPSP